MLFGWLRFDQRDLQTLSYNCVLPQIAAMGTAEPEKLEDKHRLEKTKDLAVLSV